MYDRELSNLGIVKQLQYRLPDPEPYRGTEWRYHRIRPNVNKKADANHNHAVTFLKLVARLIIVATNKIMPNRDKANKISNTSELKYFDAVVPLVGLDNMPNNNEPLPPLFAKQGGNVAIMKRIIKNRRHAIM